MAVNPLDLPTRADADIINGLLETISQDLLIASDAVGSAIDMATDASTMATDSVAVVNGKIVEIETLETSLEALKSYITDKDVVISAKEQERLLAETERISAEISRGEIFTQKISGFETTSSEKLTDFETNSVNAISDFVAETNRVEALYPTEITNLNNISIKKGLEAPEDSEFWLDIN